VSENFGFKLDYVPDLTDVTAAYPQRYPFLLDSAATGPLGRYSLLLCASDDVLSLSQDGLLDGPGVGPGFLDRLSVWFQNESKISEEPAELPFCGGWFVYLSYELAGEIEPVLDLPASDPVLPVALAVRCKGAVVIAHGETDEAYVVGEDPEIIQQILSDLNAMPVTERGSLRPIDHVEAENGSQFMDSVNRIKSYLAEGDVFQVNLSRAWHGSFDKDMDPFLLYQKLRRDNPAPFAGFMHWAGATLMSSSPERLVDVRGRVVQTRPIAGTYPRGHDTESDEALSRDMLAHPKEQAEHIMLIDLERNDLGRVCESGTVEVSELMVLESYAHVHHIVSNVKGVLREDVTPVDVIRAVFPGGTITGCPKVRCMEIIAELEQSGRGFYTGSMGYIGRDGQMDLNILIRSMLINKGQVSLRTGAGIVADSVPEKELAETVAKARGVLNALKGSELGADNA
jgi:anthranilate synthase component 1